jgi:hypothetical protein
MVWGFDMRFLGRKWQKKYQPRDNRLKANVLAVRCQRNEDGRCAMGIRERQG